MIKARPELGTPSETGVALAVSVHLSTTLTGLLGRASNGPRPLDRETQHSLYCTADTANLRV